MKVCFDPPSNPFIPWKFLHHSPWHPPCGHNCGALLWLAVTLRSLAHSTRVTLSPLALGPTLLVYFYFNGRFFLGLFGHSSIHLLNICFWPFFYAHRNPQICPSRSLTSKFMSHSWPLPCTLNLFLNLPNVHLYWISSLTCPQWNSWPISPKSVLI